MSSLCTAPQALRPARAGFSAIELLVVITIVAILAGIIGPAMGGIQARMDTDNARDGFILYAARARTLAIDRGSLTSLTIDPVNDRAVIAVGNTPTDSLDFAAEYGVDLSTGSDARIVVCYSSRGIAMPSCNSGLGADVDIVFSRGSETASVVLRPLGQVKRRG